MIEVHTWIDEAPRGSRGSFWIAECTLADGRTFTARSQHGAANELARQLVAAGIADDAMETFNTDSGLKELRYRSFHAIAKWTYTEGNGLLQRVPYRSPEEIQSAFQRKPENRVETAPDVPERGSVVPVAETA